MPLIKQNPATAAKAADIKEHSFFIFQPSSALNSVEDITVNIEIKQYHTFIPVNKIYCFLSVDVIYSEINIIISERIILVIHPSDYLPRSRPRYSEHIIDFVQEQISSRTKKIVCVSLSRFKEI